MGMEVFEHLVNKIAWKMNLSGATEIEYNEYKKRYEASVGGVRFYGNSISNKITVNWGSGHTSMLDRETIDTACA